MAMYRYACRDIIPVSCHPNSSAQARTIVHARGPQHDTHTMAVVVWVYPLRFGLNRIELAQCQAPPTPPGYSRPGRQSSRAVRRHRLPFSTGNLAARLIARDGAVCNPDQRQWPTRPVTAAQAAPRKAFRPSTLVIPTSSADHQ